MAWRWTALGGHSQSILFPTTPGAYQEDFVGEILGCDVPFGADYNCDDVFLARIATDGAMDYATYLGGHQIDHCYAVAANSSGEVYAVGHTKSDDFPPFASGTFYQNFLTKLSSSGAELIYTALYDTNSPTPAYVTVDAAGDIYFAGTVNSPGGLLVVKLRDPGLARPGDLDCDGDVDFDDIDGFVLALSGQAAYEAANPDCNWHNADTNGDGAVDFGDIDPFVSVLSGG